MVPEDEPVIPSELGEILVGVKKIPEKKVFSLTE